MPARLTRSTRTRSACGRVNGPGKDLDDAEYVPATTRLGQVVKSPVKIVL